MIQLLFSNQIKVLIAYIKILNLVLILQTILNRVDPKSQTICQIVLPIQGKLKHKDKLIKKTVDSIPDFLIFKVI